MTWKQFIRRFDEIIADSNRNPVNCTDLKAWQEEQKRLTEERIQEAEEKAYRLAHWFEQDVYVRGTPLKRMWLRLRYIFLDITGGKDLPEIPAYLRMEMARCLLPDIIAFYESEEGKAEFQKWKAEQDAQKEKSKVS